MTTSVLIVDDDPGHLSMLETLIQGWGYSVDRAEDGSVAVLKIKERAFDLVLMDVRMAEMSGIEALREIIKIDPKAKVIMVSSLNQKDLVVKALSEGAKNYVLKPMSKEKTLSVVAEVLAK